MLILPVYVPRLIHSFRFVGIEQVFRDEVRGHAAKEGEKISKEHPLLAPIGFLSLMQPDPLKILLRETGDSASAADRLPELPFQFDLVEIGVFLSPFKKLPVPFLAAEPDID
jgi:hypothetical protein